MSTRTGTGWPSSHAGSPSVAGSSGSADWCCPAVLDTPAQRLYEQFGGHSKGRGVTAEVFDVAWHARRRPLYPLPASGVGASMAFNREALLRSAEATWLSARARPLGAGGHAAICDLMLDRRARSCTGRAPGGVARAPRGVRGGRAPAQRLRDRHRRGFFTPGRSCATRAACSRWLGWPPARSATWGAAGPTATMDGGYPAALRRASVRGMLSGPFGACAAVGRRPGRRPRRPIRSRHGGG